MAREGRSRGISGTEAAALYGRLLRDRRTLAAARMRIEQAMGEHPGSPYVSVYITRRQAEALSRLLSDDASPQDAS